MNIVGEIISDNSVTKECLQNITCDWIRHDIIFSAREQLEKSGLQRKSNIKYMK